jgi:hypothetical protein
MIDRQSLGDVLLAVLVAIPAAALARPGAAPLAHPALSSPPAQRDTAALASAADREVGLFR